MSYYIKACPKCGAINHPSLTQCGKCGADLPTDKIESKVAPPNPMLHAKYIDEAVTVAHDDHHAEVMACRITDIDLPFWSMVNFMVKWAIAAIPAFIILIILGVFTTGILAAIGTSLGH